MSGDTSNFRDVQIFGREYRVACNPGEEAGLLAAVELVDGKMREIADKAKKATTENIAVMAAINLVHEKNQPQGGASLAPNGENIESGFESSDLRRRIQDMGVRLDAVLGL